jgi:hypothetical protein
MLPPNGPPPQIFELFGRNFCHLCVVVLLRTENTCRPGQYGRESSLQGGQQAGFLAIPARPAMNRGGGAGGES